MTQIMDLETEKQDAIAREDFVVANTLKKEIEKLQAAVTTPAQDHVNHRCIIKSTAAIFALRSRTI